MPTSRNPRAGLPLPPAQPGEEFCSTPTGEQLAGTAKTGKIILALEYQRGWGRDILDGEALGSQLTKEFQAYLSTHGAQLQFIRKPGRPGQENHQTRLYISWAEGEANTQKPLLEALTLTQPRALLDLELGTPGHTPGAQRIHHPLLLICTHGKRDRCCAMRGRPLAAELHQLFPGDAVWESSHTKGHRFAPSMLLLPSNYSYGRMGTAGATGIMQHATHGQLWLQGNRGRGIWDTPGQVAELSVARLLAAEEIPVAPAELVVSTEENTQPTTPHDRAIRYVSAPAYGRKWRVELEQRNSVPITASCHDTPTLATSWVALKTQPVEA